MTTVTTHVKTLRQIDKIKSAIIGKTYELSMVKTYVSHWGMVEAVREVIQNALDSASPFIYEFRIEEDGKWTLLLNSELSLLTPQTLLLGATNKEGNMIGSFGEGYKIALLVLTRLGIDVIIRNGDLIWKPRFKYSRTFDDDLLVIDESLSNDKLNKGITYIIKGLDDNDKQEIIYSCLRMQDSIGAIRQTKYGDILLDRKGKLYIGSLYICDTQMHYGYNIKPEHIRLERDRKTVEDWDLQQLTLKMWYDLDDPTRVARMIYENVPDVKWAQYSAPELIKEECYKIFRELHPNALIADSPKEAQEAIRDGLIKTVYVGGGGFYSGVTSSSSYKKDLQSTAPVKRTSNPQDLLRDFRGAWEKSMSKPCCEAFNDLISKAGNWGIVD